MRPRVFAGIAAVVLCGLAAAAGCAVPRFSNAPVLSERPIADVVACAGEAERLRSDARFLADPALAGRRTGTDGAAAARAFIVDRFRELALTPYFADRYEDPFATATGERGVNVAAVHGTRAAGRELVIVGAHYDHLGAEDGTVYPGADDNASGVAIVLEAARRLRDRSLARDVAFVAFDAEEPPFYLTGSMGSERFVAARVDELRRTLAAAVILDLIGGGSIPGRGALYVAGAEASPELADAVLRTPATVALDVVPVGVHLIDARPYQPWRYDGYSDYDAFRDAGFPFVFLSTGRTPRYHTPEDRAETLDYHRMDCAAGYLAALVAAIAQGPRPTYIKDQIDLRADFRALLASVPALLTAPPLGLRAQTRAKLEEDLVELRRIEPHLRGEPRPGFFRVRRVEMIAVRAQCAAAYPAAEICTAF